jgi:hypothetical protein
MNTILLMWAVAWEKKDSMGISMSSPVCPSCGTEFGYDDSSETHADLRKKWVSGGMLWWSNNLVAPPDWDPVEQLNALRRHMVE